MSFEILVNENILHIDRHLLILEGGDHSWTSLGLHQFHMFLYVLLDTVLQAEWSLGLSDILVQYYPKYNKMHLQNYEGKSSSFLVLICVPSSVFYTELQWCKHQVRFFNSFKAHKRQIKGGDHILVRLIRKMKCWEVKSVWNWSLKSLSFYPSWYLKFHGYSLCCILLCITLSIHLHSNNFM